MKTKKPEPNLPFFVYGTLLKGHPNHDYVCKEVGAPVRITAGTYFGAQLVVRPRGVFPYLIPNPDLPRHMAVGSEKQQCAKGELHYFTDKQFKKVLELLDELEGVEYGHYERRPAEIWADGDTHMAYVYVPTAAIVRHLFPDPYIGDSWDKYVKQHNIYKLREVE